MNQRIKDLAENINPQAREVYQGDWPYNCAAWTGEEITRFAEALIEECAVLTERSTSRPFRTYGELIRSKFGIKNDTVHDAKDNK
jgi:hypothetical protein